MDAKSGSAERLLNKLAMEGNLREDLTTGAHSPVLLRRRLRNSEILFGGSLYKPGLETEVICQENWFFFQIRVLRTN